MRDAASFLRAHCDKEFCVHDVSRRVNLSDSYLAHLFRQEAGVPIQKFLKIVRLHRARELLETTYLSVKQVTAQVGFKHPSHFVREFHKRFGQSPAAYRSRHRQRIAG